MLPQMPKVDLGRPATYDDLVAVPDHLVAEIVDGELWTSPRPAPRHATAHTELLVELAGRLRRSRGGPGGWRILLEPELHLGDQAVVPDIAGWRLERMPQLPDTAYFAVSPDWVCENPVAVHRVARPREETTGLRRARRAPRVAGGSDPADARGAPPRRRALDAAGDARRRPRRACGTLRVARTGTLPVVGGRTAGSARTSHRLRPRCRLTPR